MAGLAVGDVSDRAGVDDVTIGRHSLVSNLTAGGGQVESHRLGLGLVQLAADCQEGDGRRGMGRRRAPCNAWGSFGGHRIDHTLWRGCVNGANSASGAGVEGRATNARWNPWRTSAAAGEAANGAADASLAVDEGTATVRAAVVAVVLLRHSLPLMRTYVRYLRVTEHVFSCQGVVRWFIERAGLRTVCGGLLGLG